MALHALTLWLRFPAPVDPFQEAACHHVSPENVAKYSEMGFSVPVVKFALRRVGDEVGLSRVSSSLTVWQFCPHVPTKDSQSGGLHACLTMSVQHAHCSAMLMVEELNLCTVRVMLPLHFPFLPCVSSHGGTLSSVTGCFGIPVEWLC